MATLRIVEIYHVEFRLDFAVTVLMRQQMVVGYLAQIRAFEIIDISTVPFLYHLFDEGVDYGV